MPRHSFNIRKYGIAIIALMVAMLLFSACSPSHKKEVDKLNTLSYSYHYRSLDSTKVLAERALQLSEGYRAGYAEACNNLAFVAIAKMNYKQAKKWLAEVENASDNQIELLIADIQNMRLCQREARNKDFYMYREKSMRLLRRVGEEANALPDHERRRAIYAKSEFHIVSATYFYYVGLEDQMRQSLNNIVPEEVEQDTAQYLNCLYNFGAGGALIKGTTNEINQDEFDFLMQAYMLASGPHPYPYWLANVLQAISEHLQNKAVGDYLIANNLPAFQYLNVEKMPDHLLAGNFAQRALNLFQEYGDVYQVAGANRTLAECYFFIGDYASAETCLLHALNANKAIMQAPDLVASIREQLSLVYSAIDDKPKSDYNRNIYLDLQEQSRQDRLLEARAAQLDENAMQLNVMIAAVITLIVVACILLYVFDRMRRRNDKDYSEEKLLEPLHQWKNRNVLHLSDLSDRKEELDEQLAITQLHVEENKKRNLEQRAKVSLVNSIMPFIDRMVNEVNRLCEDNESDTVRKERYDYIAELTAKINQYNDVLTQWIQMRQGHLNLRIESFPLQPLFEIVAKGKMSFKMKGVDLQVQATDLVVKADRTLTLFMINTIADNARKFTPAGGNVMVSARKVESCIEISVSDTGGGMDEESLAHLFDRTYTGGHGFGLLNCKGIIEKYKKLSSIFSVCDIQAKSQPGKGSTFTFRLPCGVMRLLMAGWLLMSSMMPGWAANHLLQRADEYADSAYFSNINGKYEHTLEMADSARKYLNRYYLSLYPDGKYLMDAYPKVGIAAELRWFRDSVPTNYQVILDLRNETAVAALALHRWNLYESNNKVYTQLFRDLSADDSLPDYVRTMQLSRNSKTVAVILLILLLLQLPLAYYLLYYRHVLRYRFAVEQVNAINRMLLSDLSDEQKLANIKQLWSKHPVQYKASHSLNEVVDQILLSLQKSIVQEHDEESNIELKEDELHRAEFENAKLHISNSVLDNCLSALKHETMYYPSRIQQVIASSSMDGIQTLRELVGYYKCLYDMLSSQAMEQVEPMVKYDKFYLYYLKELLEEKSINCELGIKVPADGTPYAVLYAELRDVMYQATLHEKLFTPLTCDLRYLLCRQIVREIGEVTNMRGCGIRTTEGEGGCLRIEATLPSKMLTEKESIENTNKE